MPRQNGPGAVARAEAGDRDIAEQRSDPRSIGRKSAPAIEHLYRLPVGVPAGKVVVHNHVRPTRWLGSRGFPCLTGRS
jgi:hypothetical protein